MTTFSQVQFLGALKARLGKDAPAWLEEHLDLSRATVFRKLSGESPLQAAELVTIIEKEPALLNQLFSFYQIQDQSLSKTLSFDNEAEFQAYLRYIRATFRGALEEDPQMKLYYRAQTFPLFLFLADRTVLSYKLAYWCDSLWSAGPAPLSELTWNLAQDVYQIYRSCPSDELWHQDAALLQYKLLDHLQAQDYLSAAQSQQLRDCFAALEERWQMWEKQKQKKEGVPFRRKITQVETLQNSGLLKHNGQQLYMGAFDLSHFIATAEPRVCERFWKRWERAW